MDISSAVIDYLRQKYSPDAIIAYGSFADGSAGEHSDFDALVIAPGARTHDSSIVAGTVLDVFVYPPETFADDYDPEEFVQVFDGRIILDKSGIAARLKRRVLDYIASIPKKSADELREEAEWCKKMLARSARGDAEGMFRWHWVLIDSLEIYFDLHGLHYYGPKKALRFMRENDQKAFKAYSRALGEFSREALCAWIELLTDSWSR